MLPIINEHRPLLRTNSICLPEQGFNEQLLLKMITESRLGQPPANLSETYWSFLATSNHHGTHIRLAECGGRQGLMKVNKYERHKTEI